MKISLNIDFLLKEDEMKKIYNKVLETLESLDGQCLDDESSRKLVATEITKQLQNMDLNLNSKKNP